MSSPNYASLFEKGALKVWALNLANTSTLGKEMYGSTMVQKWRRVFTFDFNGKGIPQLLFTCL